MKFLLTSWLFLLAALAIGQKLEVEKSIVTFFSDALLEDITATNTKARGLINTDAREASFIIPINQFQFAKKLMQEHFNEKYMESDIYPHATFSGIMSDLHVGSFQSHSVTAHGELTIHGVTREVDISGSVKWNGNRLIIDATFIVRLEDYKVAIPTLVWQNIAEEVEVKVNMTLRPVP